MEAIRNRRRTRESGIELLRILCMLLIVSTHFSMHNGFSYQDGGFSPNGLMGLTLGLLGRPGVSVFFLITGYFTFGRRFDAKRLALLWAEAIFYAACFVGLALILGRPLDARAFLPVLGNQNWFLTTYIFLCLLSPFLNALLNTLTRQRHLMLIGLLLFIVSVLPTFFRSATTGTELGTAILTYVAGAYLKRFPGKLDARRGVNAWLALGCFLCAWLPTFALYYLSDAHPGLQGRLMMFVGLYSPFWLGCCVCQFRFFKNLRPRFGRAINYIAGSMLGVYLLHESYLFRDALWQDWLRVARFENSPCLWLYAIGDSLLVFAACTLIDILRRLTVERAFVRAADAAERRFLARRRTAK